MPRYFLHLTEPHATSHDVEGVDAPDLTAAYREAVRGIRDIVSHEAIGGRINLGGRIDIEDADGNVAKSVSFGDALRIERG